MKDSLRKICCCIEFDIIVFEEVIITRNNNESCNYIQKEEGEIPETHDEEGICRDLDTHKRLRMQEIKFEV